MGGEMMPLGHVINPAKGFKIKEKAFPAGKVDSTRRLCVRGTDLFSEN